MHCLPNLLLVGAQKSGTSWTHMALSHSSKIYASNKKELNHFNKTTYNDHEQINRYKSNFIIGSERYYLESTPHYFRLPNRNGFCIASNIKSILSEELKLLVILRNPIERALSATIHNMLAKRIQYTNKINNIYDEHFILEFGYYYSILKYWKSIYGDKLQYFFYDDLENDPQKFIESILTYLDIHEELPTSIFSVRKNDKFQKIKYKKNYKLPKCSMNVIKELLDIYYKDIINLFEYTGSYYHNWLDAESIYNKFNLA